MSATLFDLTVYAFNNFTNLKEKHDQSCYFYLPKIDFLEEAIFWNDILSYLEAQLGAEPNSFKVTVIVESVIALTQLDEIIFALKERIVGLNTGRWNYIGSIVKRFRNQISSMIDSRHQIYSDSPFLQSFNLYVVHIAHKRGIHAIGGASNFVPRLN